MAQPVINSFSPTSGPVGITVTISGANFDPDPLDNIVFFGAVRANVSAASANSLTVTVPTGTTFQPLSVTTNNLIGFSNQPFIVTFAGGGAGFGTNSFYPKIDISTGPSSDPKSFFTSDLDGDGRADIVTANSYGNTISIFRNTSSIGFISFSPKLDYPTGNRPNSISVGDFNGDGKPDIVVANVVSNTISVFKNTSSAGAISMDAKIDYPTAYQPEDVSMGDFDGDGKIDIATPNANNSGISVFKNISTLSNILFEPKVDFPATANYSITVGDFDGDNKVDIAACQNAINAFCILKNISTVGNINFAPKQDFNIGISPYKIENGDVDGDNKHDILITNYHVGLTTVIKNTTAAGTLSFAPRVDYATQSILENLAIGDIDGDSKVDLAVAKSSHGGFATMFQNLCSPTNVLFGPVTEFDVADGPRNASIVDLDGDGKPEVLTVNFNSQTISILKNKIGSAPTFTGFTPQSSIPGGTITITGTNFSGPASVSLGGTAATSVTVVSSTTITAVVGSGTSGDIRVTTPNGTRTLPGFIYLPPPVISSFSPTSMYAGGTVTITGTDFTGAYAVTFGGTNAASFTVQSPTTITAVVANGTTGNVWVYTPYGYAPKAGFVFIPPPVISSFTPTTGGAGSTVNITGTGFTGTTAVSFGGVPATSFTINSSTAITATVAAGATGNVTVTNPAGNANSPGFTFTTVPIIQSFAPMNGTTGSVITLTGANLTGVTTVEFGGVPTSSFTIVSNAKITAVVAAGSSGDITVSGPAGSFNLPGFHYYTTSPNKCVTQTGSGNKDGSSWANAWSDKQLADILFLLPPGNEVWIAKGIYKPTTDSNGIAQTPGTPNYILVTFSIPRGVKMYGGFAGNETAVSERNASLVHTQNKTILSGDINAPNDQTDNVTTVAIIKTAGMSEVVDGFTIQGGKKNGLRLNFTPPFTTKPLINNCVIRDNFPLALGAGLEALGNNVTGASVDVTNTYFTANRNAKNAAAVFDKCRLKAVNCIFYNNSAQGLNESSSAIRFTTRGGEITNCTFYKNMGSLVAAAGTVTLENVTDSVYINNSIFWQNYYPNIHISSGLNMVSVKNCLYEYRAGATLPAFMINSFSRDPKFVSELNVPGADNEINTQDDGLALSTSTPLADRGNSAFVSGITRDVWGNPRINKNSVDIGAHELQSDTLTLPTILCPGSNTGFNAQHSGTSYQWKVDDSTGYVTVTDNSIYSGSNTTFLTLTQPPGSFYGNKYQCTITTGDGTFLSQVYLLRFQNTWTGSVSSAWENPANWSCGVVPEANTDVIVNSGSIIVGANTTIRSLTLNPGVTFTIQPGVVLTIMHP